MAKGKNEILLSIALEGDQDIKSKLQSIGDIGKQSMAGIEKKITDAGKAIGDLPEGGGLQKALAPVLETSGIQGALSGVTGLLSRFGGVIAGGGLPAALAAIGAHLAKINEETQQTEQRLKALGASEGAAGRLRQSARTIDAEPKDLAGGFEEFLPFKRRQEIQSPFGVADVSEQQFLTAQRALIAGAKVDNVPTADAIAKAGGFLSRLYQPHDIGDGTSAQGLAAGGLSGLSPSQANRVARAVGGEIGLPFRNAEELSLFLEQKDSQGRSPVIRPDAVFRALQRDEPAARAEAEKHRTVGDANERVKGRLSDIQDSLSDIFGEPSGKAATGFTDTISEGLGHIRQRIDANKPLAKAFGESGRDLGERTGIPGAARAGELLGTTEGLGFGVLRDAAKGYGVIGRSVGDALGLSPGTTPTVSPEAPYGFLQPLQQRELEQQRIRDKMQSAPVPPQPAPGEQPATLGPRSEVQQPQQVADLSGALMRVLETISAAANNANKPDLKVDEPAAGGIRGDAEDGAKSSIAEFRDVASLLSAAIADAAADIKKASGGSPVTVQAAAWGGLIRRLDGGGHISGPGTSTSDSIPAMLSDGEYVIRASSAKKLGRANLDWLNSGAPGLASGGAVKRFADGGDAEDDGDTGDVIGRTLANANTLGPGDHQIQFDPTTGGAFIDGILHVPGDPLLDDPLVKSALAQSKAGMNQKPSKNKYKSDFVGRFGHSDDADTYVAEGGPIGHFAGGGAIGNLLRRQISLPQLAIGGAVGFDGSIGHGSEPLLSESSSGGGEHHVVDLRTNSGNYPVKIEKNVLDQMKKAARDSAVARTGEAPSWYR
ncbi:hypothetical protein ACVIHI_005783 [Bradyrhizobium sp. USDA 4524]|uniref:hypothetical protein n=1 Tax=unclassified Bradyrhizobium TaxID=2631580 RepID=UPI0020A1D75E|nr:MULTISPECIES: hypothetical protein [unclassified Bradyrhizobium]MCP1841296.1 hypothetical protein [Bradyrhizobium sp. USDA 4538]MCP1901859.1 hypothetical protein [Bradyrhizobium sp. USDA 4537]MCP1992484.1 hypothetical protein [Bradyrhizobium sp. USDA 4539]